MTDSNMRRTRSTMAQTRPSRASESAAFTCKYKYPDAMRARGRFVAPLWRGGERAPNLTERARLNCRLFDLPNVSAWPLRTAHRFYYTFSCSRSRLRGPRGENCTGFAHLGSAHARAVRKDHDIEQVHSLYSSTAYVCIASMSSESKAGGLW